MVRVPESDVVQKRAAPGLVFGGTGGPEGHPMIRILSGDQPPEHTYVAVKYDDRWFWISNDDIRSKSTFGILILLFSIAETGVKGAAPVVTILANQ